MTEQLDDALTDDAMNAAERRRGVLESDRRTFMKRLMITAGAAAFTTMGGRAIATAAPSATASSTATPSATPTGSAAPTGMPTGSPPTGGGTGASSGADTVTDDFFGLTSDGNRIDDLYTIRAAHVGTASIVAAASSFLASLDDTQRAAVQFDVRSTEWRQWSNVDSYTRNGVQLGDMTAAQKAAGLDLVRAGLSARGITVTDTIRRINGVAGRIIGSTVTFNEEYYFFTIMGTPSTTEPWGWQFEGHHLVLNYFVLADQVVATPSFFGSEPTSVTDDQTGLDLKVFDDFFALGLQTINALSPTHKAAAILSSTKTGDNNVAEAFKDNVVVPYAGVSAQTFSRTEQLALLALANHFLELFEIGHAKVKFSEFRAHLSETYFAWVGATTADAVFWFRIQSPVLYIEFDCELPGPLGSVYGAGQGSGPSRQHVHSVVRTPNGNDYGKELLRMHYATSPHHQQS